MGSVPTKRQSPRAACLGPDVASPISTAAPPWGTPAGTPSSRSGPFDPDGVRATAGEAKIRCDRCSAITVVPCGTVQFACKSCGAKVRVVLHAMSQLARNRVGEKVSQACQAIDSIMLEQASLCQRLRSDLEDEIQVQEVLWTSQQLEVDADWAREACALVRNAFAQHDTAQVVTALSHVSECGLPPVDPSLVNALERLRQEEDLEVMWRCLKRAIEDKDRVDLELWRDEATARGLHVPEEVETLRAALEGEERARLVEMRFQADFDSRTAAAIENENVSELEALVNEARLLGTDASAAAAALSSLPRRSTNSDAQIPAGRPQSGVYNTSSDSPSPTPTNAGRTQSKTSASSASNSSARAQPAPPPWTPTPPPQAKSAAPKAPSASRSKGRLDPGPQWAGNPNAPRPDVKGQPRRPQPASSTSGRASCNGANQQQRKQSVAATPKGMTHARALECLGLSGQDPSREELRRAYKVQALRWHPDRPQNHGCEEQAKARFQDVRAAFDFLQAGAR